MVSPQPLVDTYTLRCPISNVVEPEPAHVGDYKTSVLLNSLFRTVRENASLDAAEESEDESLIGRHEIPLQDYEAMPMEKLVEELEVLVAAEKVMSVREHITTF
jgi:hypothetical protein